MTPRKLNLACAFFNYGGNGGISSEVPALRYFALDLHIAAKSHPSIDKIWHFDLSDTPITMTRNHAVRTAKQLLGADLLLMVDSDMHPDLYLGKDPFAKPFFTSSLEFILSRYEKGPVFVCAPYCGPPPEECVYVFRWENDESATPDVNGRLEMWPRHEAATMGGIGEVGACPTGLILWDMRIFDLREPPYFYYEFKDRWHDEKASTEDVVATRDLSFAGSQKLGYNPAFCNWDAWAGHWKPKCVGKPIRITADQVATRYADAAHAPCIGSRMMDVGADGRAGLAVDGAIPDEILRRQQDVAAMRAQLSKSNGDHHALAGCAPSQ